MAKKRLNVEKSDFNGVQSKVSIEECTKSIETMCAAFYYEKNGANFAIGSECDEPTSLGSLPFTFDKRHYKKDSRFVNDLYTLTYDDHESLDSVRLFSTFANQVSGNCM